VLALILLPKVLLIIVSLYQAGTGPISVKRENPEPSSSGWEKKPRMASKGKGGRLVYDLTGDSD